MEYNEMLNAKKYLRTFDEILYNMAHKMLSATIVNNITLDFIRCMIPHHQAAIYMCKNLLNYTNYLPLQDIANNIIKMQTQGIAQMEEIEKTTSGFSSSPTDVRSYMTEYRNITKNMISRMKNSSRTVNINLNFTSEMIPHHEGAIAMCENLLNYRIDPRLKDVAINIIKEQSRGVTELEQVKNNLCKQ